jgi:BirA family biotin operon repressor/biotin-[acetyl-CoA-carboxylase] ligase
LWTSVTVIASTGSTNADLRAAALDGAAEGTVIVAEEQTSGRGRLNRTWSSPPRAGIAVSVLLRPRPVPAQRWGLLPLMTGVAVCEAIDGVSRLDVGLKWPNDVLVDERKLGGILAERIDTPAAPALVVGVGLNVSLRSDELPGPEATSLVLAGADVVDRMPILLSLLRHVADGYAAWQRGDDERLKAAYRSRCTTIGREVTVQLPGGKSVEGIASGVDRDGHLVVSGRDGPVAVASGDVIHVRPLGPPA